MTADKDAKYAKEAGLAFLKAERTKFTAPANRVTNATVRETYRTGDGDTPVSYRPGALDFKKHPSKGLG